MRASRGLKWENKMYKPKRSIVLKRPLESVLVELKDFRASFSAVFVSKLR